MSNQLSILHFSHKPFLPKIDGGCIAINHISDLLIEKTNLSYFTLETTKHPFNKLDYKSIASAQSVFVNTKINPFYALTSLILNKNYNVSRFYSKKAKEKLIEIIKNNSFDIVILESLFTCPYIEDIRTFFKGKIFLRSHNIEHQIWERNAINETSLIKKLYLKILSKQLKKYELSTWNKVDGILSISPLDSSFIKTHSKTPILELPFGLNSIESKTNEISKPIQLYHLGAMNWHPNLFGVKWFIKKVIPLIKTQNIKVNLAGMGMPDSLLKESSEQVNIKGLITEPLKFYKDKHILIVPLFSGSGIRIKILEAMSLGKCIISTSIGVEGIIYEENKNILIANDEFEFASHITHLEKNPDKIIEIGEAAIRNIKEHYDNKILSQRLIDFLSKKNI